jgi:hypothetical protein
MRTITEPFLINSFSNPHLISNLIAEKVKNKHSIRSGYIINYWEINNIER